MAAGAVDVAGPGYGLSKSPGAHTVGPEDGAVQGVNVHTGLLGELLELRRIELLKLALLQHQIEAAGIAGIFEEALLDVISKGDGVRKEGQVHVLGAQAVFHSDCAGEYPPEEICADEVVCRGLLACEAFLASCSQRAGRGVLLLQEIEVQAEAHAGYAFEVDFGLSRGGEVVIVPVHIKAQADAAII